MGVDTGIHPSMSRMTHSRILPISAVFTHFCAVLVMVNLGCSSGDPGRDHAAGEPAVGTETANSSDPGCDNEEAENASVASGASDASGAGTTASCGEGVAGGTKEIRLTNLPVDAHGEPTCHFTNDVSTNRYGVTT